MSDEIGRAHEVPPHRFHRFGHGEFDVTILSDGHIRVPIGIVLPDGSPAERADVLDATGDAATGLVTSRCNVPLLRRGADLVLVDVGSGDKFQPTDGALPANLVAAGIDPGDVTRVVLTHAHPDHLWGMLREDGSLRFPNATYHVGAAEWDFWMDPDCLAKVPTEVREFALGNRRDLAAIADRVVLLRPGDEVVGGLRALATPGHTPGHISLEVAGAGDLLITGDVATNQVASFRNPRARFGFDMQPDLATGSRTAMLDRAAVDRTPMLGFHWAYPGLGYADRRGAGYAYVPA